MTAHSDPTFRNYQPLQAEQYAQARTSYPVALYNHVLKHHPATSGQFKSLLNVGCGPGNATRDMALAFEEAQGVDPGEEMIHAARSLGGKTKSGSKIRFEVCSAESCASAPGFEAGTVDLIISATAAHWFDMPQFWEQVARLLRPGGTVALWTLASYYGHPDNPNVAEVNNVLLRFEREVLAPFEVPGNRVSRDMYDNLVLPWIANPEQTDFPTESFCRDEWDRDGVLSDGNDFFGGSEERPLEKVEKGFGTASMVTRWRAAHPELAGTEKDVTKEMIATLRPWLNGKGLRAGSSTVILLLKKRG